MSSPDRALDVVVIGGGLAGVRTALGLHDSGRSFALLEANGRLGGRVKTIRDPSLPGGVFDVGARQIGQGYRRTWELIARFGLHTVDEAVQALPTTYLIGGEFITPDAWPTSSRNPFPEPFRSLPLPLQGPSFLTRHDPFTSLDDWRTTDALVFDVPVGDHLRADGFSDEAIRLVQLSLGGLNPHRTSLLTLLQEHHRLLDELRLTSGGSMAIEQITSARGDNATTPPPPRRAIQNIVGGTGALVDAMASSFASSVLCGHVITAIDVSSAIAAVTCENGAVFRARRVVLAAPFTAVRSIAVTPPLPAPQRSAVAAMGYTHNTRVWARVTRRFWHDDGLPPSTFSDAPFRAAYALRDPATDDHTMMFLMSGDAATEIGVGPATVADRVLSTFTAARPAAVGALVPFLTSSWATEPHIGGLRHSYAPGQMTAWLPSVDQPHGRLHFAGEHTRRQEMGMEAALESAERVLSELAVA